MTKKLKENKNTSLRQFQGIKGQNAKKNGERKSAG